MQYLVISRKYDPCRTTRTCEVTDASPPPFLLAPVLAVCVPPPRDFSCAQEDGTCSWAVPCCDALKCVADGERQMMILIAMATSTTQDL